MKIFLQPETLNYYRKFKKLSLDNKTRWTSLKRMLKDFLAIEHALKMAGKPFLLTETDIEKLRSLANILTIFELAVNNLSKRNATLIDLEKIIKFTTTKLTAIGTPLAKTFLNAFEKRMLERRNAKLIHVIKYLENPSFIKEKKDQCGEKIVRKDIETMI